MNIIPALLRDGRKMYAYRFAGYWRDVGTIDSLWEANMEVLDPENSGIDIFDEKWKIYSRNPVLPPQKIGPALWCRIPSSPRAARSTAMCITLC